MKDFEWVDVEQETPPEQPRWYDVLRANLITKYLYETLGRWNGHDWFGPSNYNITNEVKYWKKKGR